MKKKYIFTLTVLLFSKYCFGINEETLIRQGPIELTFSDIDGYSYTIPNDIRAGFFDSPDRIDKTLDTMLLKKHVVNYAKMNKLVNEELINEKISDYLLENENKIIKLKLTDLEFLKLKKYLNLKYTYSYMQSMNRKSIVESDVYDLAYEEYLITKNKYYNEEELRNIRYINIKYSSNNKEQQYKIAKDIHQKLKEKSLTFDELLKEYESFNDIEFIDNIDDFHYNEKFKLFSDHIFQPAKIGLIDNILDAKNRFIISIITKITPKGISEFNEVKDSIINRLMKERALRKFGDLVSKLTTDTIEINEENIISLRTRYLTNSNQD